MRKDVFLSTLLYSEFTHKSSTKKRAVEKEIERFIIMTFEKSSNVIRTCSGKNSTTTLTALENTIFSVYQV